MVDEGIPSGVVGKIDENLINWWWSTVDDVLGTDCE